MGIGGLRWVWVWVGWILGDEAVGGEGGQTDEGAGWGEAGADLGSGSHLTQVVTVESCL